MPESMIYKAGNTGAMVALFVPLKVAKNLALPDGLPPEELHVTLAYLGEAADLEKPGVVHEVAEKIAAKSPPLRGNIQGIARFCNGEEKDPFLLLPDLPALPQFRQNLVSQLEYMGIDHSRDHGYTPHITAKYIEKEDGLPFDRTPVVPVTFDRISVVLGEKRIDYPLAGGGDLVARMDLPQLTQAILVMRGDAGSGNWGHKGRKGKHGGSQGGAGLKAIGAKPGSSVQERRKAARKKSAKQSGSGAKESPKPKAKPKSDKQGGSKADTDPDTWNKRITDKEKDAILTYTTSKYQSINGGLRKGKLSKEDAATVEQLDSALNKSRLKKETTLYENQKLYRAASIPEVNAALNSGNAVGFEFTEKGYSSTTTNKDIARNFQRESDSRLFTIKAGPGTKAASVSELSNLSGEDEVLVGRGTKYRITGVEKVKERIPYRDLKGKTKYRTKTIEYVNLEVVDQR